MKKKKCLNCGTENPPGADYCAFCSAPVEKEIQPVSDTDSGWKVAKKNSAASDSGTDQKTASAQQPKPTGLAIGALICGALGIFGVCSPFLGIAAVILAKLTFQNIQNGKEPEKSRRTAQIAMIAGIAGILISIGRWFYFFTSYGVNIFDF